MIERLRERLMSDGGRERENKKRCHISFMLRGLGERQTREYKELAEVYVCMCVDVCAYLCEVCVHFTCERYFMQQMCVFVHKYMSVHERHKNKGRVKYKTAMSLTGRDGLKYRYGHVNNLVQPRKMQLFQNKIREI